MRILRDQYLASLLTDRTQDITEGKITDAEAREEAAKERDAEFELLVKTNDFSKVLERINRIVHPKSPIDR